MWRLDIFHFPLVVRPAKEPRPSVGGGELAGTAMVDALIHFVGNVGRNLVAYLVVAAMYALATDHSSPALFLLKVAAVFLAASFVWLGLGIWWPLPLRDQHLSPSEKVLRFSAAILLFLGMAKTFAAIN